MSEWKERIKQWAISGDRNLIEGSTTGKQMDKLLEEVKELREGLLNQNSDEIKDAIGDIQVVLAVMCCQLGIDIDECREIAWEEIKDRKGKMVDGVFVKEAQS
jgi:NTP pyrophosphatase (non-canonical NTP hydrolase)